VGAATGAANQVCVRAAESAKIVALWWDTVAAASSLYITSVGIGRDSDNRALLLVTVMGETACTKHTVLHRNSFYRYSIQQGLKKQLNPVFGVGVHSVDNYCMQLYGVCSSPPIGLCLSDHLSVAIGCFLMSLRQQ
jgi:hypothetical protein